MIGNYWTLPCFVEVNGEYIYVSDYRQLCDVIERTSGHEVSEIVLGICEDCDKEKAYAEQAVFTDLDAYEEDLDDWAATGQEILDAIQNFKEWESSHKNMSRDKVHKLLETISKSINNMM